MGQTIYLDTDVLVIGGGAAGARAALAANQAGLKVVLVVKGFVGKSGCSVYAANLDYFAPPGEKSGEAQHPITEEDRTLQLARSMEFSAKFTHYLGDQEYLKDSWEFTHNEFYPWIEELGLYILRDEHGAIISDEPQHSLAWAVQQGMSGQLVMDILRKQILRSDIHLMEETAATRLLTRDGEVVGAAALDFRQGQFYIIRAKAVILATGFSNYLSLRATGTREGAANGWVMAYEAGARLQNLEMQWYHASDVAYPASWMRLHMYPNPLPGTRHRAQLVNRKGEVFFDPNWYAGNPVTYFLQCKELIRQVQAGNADFDGGFYSSFRHVEPAVLEKYFHQTQFMEKIGINLQTQVMENGITWHMNVGGVRVDGKTMESGVPGLLVAGSVNGLFTGGITNVMYDGLIAVRRAAERLRSLPGLPALDDSQVRAEEARVCSLLRTEPAQGLLPGQVKKRIRKLIWERFNLIKTEASMRSALEGLRQIEAEDLPRMRLQTDTSRFNYDWVDALDAVDMLIALKLEIEFSLYRQESRGALYREDYPNTDNENWLVHVVGHRGADGALQLSRVPVALPYARPKESVANYFDVDY